MSTSHAPARHSAAFYDALEAVDAFVRTRLPAPRNEGPAAPSAGLGEQPAPRRRAARKPAATDTAVAPAGQPGPATTVHGAALG